MRETSERETRRGPRDTKRMKTRKEGDERDDTQAREGN